MYFITSSYVLIAEIACVCCCTGAGDDFVRLQLAVQSGDLATLPSGDGGVWLRHIFDVTATAMLTPGATAE